MSTKLTPAILVNIDKDRELVLAFHKWMSENHIYSLPRSAGGSGPDYYSYTHHAEHAPAIEKFFKDFKRARKKASKEA